MNGRTHDPDTQDSQERATRGLSFRRSMEGNNEQPTENDLLRSASANSQHETQQGARKIQSPSAQHHYRYSRQSTQIQSTSPARRSNQDSSTSSGRLVSISYDSRGRVHSSIATASQPAKLIPATSVSSSTSITSTSLPRSYDQNQNHHLSRKRKSIAPEHETPKGPKSTPKGKPRGKPIHKYELDHETFLAKVLARPRIYELLNFTGDRDRFSIPKMEVHRELAVEFNENFEANLDARQVKNKVASMLRLWRAANELRSKASNRELPDSALKPMILKECHFYYILKPLWFETLCKPTKKRLASSSEVPDGGLSDSDDESDDNADNGDGQDDISEHVSSEIDELEQDQQDHAEQQPPPMSPSPKRSENQREYSEHQTTFNEFAKQTPTIIPDTPVLDLATPAPDIEHEEVASGYGRRMEELDRHAFIWTQCVKHAELQLEIEKTKLERIKLEKTAYH
ncbi:hypothetical protein BGX27_007540 [Mortierella sp. AM989]|nr:hypothetical protein BGX27_007540 [Mortierella sp. AM989]